MTRPGPWRDALRATARTAGGALLVVLGTVMLVTPGPGLLAIFLGLRLLGLGPPAPPTP